MTKQDYFIYLFLAIILYVACNYMFNAPVTTKLSPKEIEVSQALNYENLKDPEQTPYINLKNIYIPVEKNNYKLKIFPQANYRIYAMVMSKHRYYFGWEGEIIPYDLALAWNELMLPENQKGITYTQSNRWYYYSFDETFPLQQSYIISHSSNHHIIPANMNVLSAIDKVRIHEKIYMEGYLVNINGTVGKSNVYRNTSLNRNDTGAGACEVLYVTRAVLNGKIFD